MIIGSIESTMPEVREAIANNGGTTEGINMVELASKLFNGGRPMEFEVVGIQMTPGDQFRSNSEFPWSTEPTNGYITFGGTGVELTTGYLEVLSDNFRIYFIAN